MPEETLPRPMHPEKKRNILSMWHKGIKEILRQSMLPRILVSIRVDSHLEQKYQINVAYPGLTAKQALPLLAMAAQAVAEKAKREEVTDGPRIVLPR